MSKKGYKEVEVEIDDQTFLKIAKLAHEKDITFNYMCEQLLEQYIKETK